MHVSTRSTQYPSQLNLRPSSLPLKVRVQTPTQGSQPSQSQAQENQVPNNPMAAPQKVTPWRRGQKDVFKPQNKKDPQAIAYDSIFK